MIRTLVLASAALALAGVASATPPSSTSTDKPAASAPAKPDSHAAKTAHKAKIDCTKDVNKTKKACKAATHS